MVANKSPNMHRLLLLAAIAVLTLATSTTTAQERKTLPEGPVGVAATYLGDCGIEKDKRVLFSESFNSLSLTDVTKRWESIKGKNIMSLSSDVPFGSGDNKSLLMTHVGGQGTGGHLYRRLLPGHKQVFARFYVKFDPACAQIHHFGTHLGGFKPSTPWPQDGAGERPDGNKRLTTGVEPFGRRWQWDFYTYWQGMHIHGDSNYWGTPFLSGTQGPLVKRGRWICVEMMIKVNEPVSESNGEQVFWIDGKLVRRDGQIVSHIGKGFPQGRWAGGWWQPDSESKTAFKGFRWRNTEELAVNYVWVYLYITKSPRNHVSKVWFDNIVIATEYIGPLSPVPDKTRD